MNFVFKLNDYPSVPISGIADRFPVRRVYCVGQNYINHAIEMGVQKNRIQPFFFNKPADALCYGCNRIPYPSATKDFQHEIELVVAIGKKGKKIRELESLEYVFGYAVGLDLTRRDLQIVAKKNRQPWTTAKSFDFSAPCSKIHLASRVGYLDKGEITLTVNDKIRQKGDISDMIWSVNEIISILSFYFELYPGDLIFTGTPEGVGQLKKGDKIIGEVENLDKLILEIF